MFRNLVALLLQSKMACIHRSDLRILDILLERLRARWDKTLVMLPQIAKTFGFLSLKYS